MSQRNQTSCVLGTCVVLSALLFILPGLTVETVAWTYVDPPQNTEPTTILEAAEDPAPTLAPLAQSPDLDSAIPLLVRQGEAVVEMTLADYLVGVVSAEMPASFSLEALKAQACAARTYTMYQIQNQSNHTDAHVCTDANCCQAYIDDATASANWGTMAEAYASRIRTAVQATDGQTIDYAGSPILAVFHASSVGQTRQAGDVWLTDLPYLQSVSSPETAQDVPDYQTQVDFTVSALKNQLQIAFPQGDFSTPPQDWLQAPITTDTGTVETLTVGAQSVSGTALRSALGLRSACFTWTIQDDVVTFLVTGYGHGVGLSQYGANTMAQAGADYLEILTHYYTGVSVETQCASAMANSLQ